MSEQPEESSGEERSYRVSGPENWIDPPGDISEEAPAEPVRTKSRRTSGDLKFRSIAAFLAFVLGVSLIVGNLGAVAGRWAWQRDTNRWWSSDWQDTAAFRWKVSGCLQDFLTLGAGGKSLSWYDPDRYWEYGIADYGITDYGRSFSDSELEEILNAYAIQRDEAVLWRGGDQSTTVIESEKVPVFAFDIPLESPQQAAGVRLVSNVTVPDSSRQHEQQPDDPKEKNLTPAPDAAFRQNQNVLYKVTKADGTVYSNLESGQKLDNPKNLPEGFNFYLSYQDGKVSITKEGKELDVYGNGVYTDESLWYVPGYQNFKAGSEVDGVSVLMAVRAVPLRCIMTDYSGYGAQDGDRMYWLYQDIQQSRNFYRNAAVYLAAGCVLLGLWFLLRRHREPVDRKIAGATKYIWTEVRFLLVAAFVLCLFLRTGDSSDLFYQLYYEEVGLDYLMSVLGRSMLMNLENTAPLLGLTWLLWLIHNDHRYNPKEGRRSLFRSFRARELKRPIQKRVSRNASIQILCGCALALCVLIATVLGMQSSYFASILFLAVLLLIPAAWTILGGRNELHLAQDIGLLADQVEAVRTGDLSTPLDLPDDADLHQTAEALNDIQSGMKAALEEQTRSERMKVELVSNVSHDLKTPLTSILSYAELLRQETLPPAAADYARIIDEKAQRLKSMVEDVFEVSKAAADQLPVHIERLDLAKLLRQTLADMDAPIQKSALSFKIDLPEEPVMISADGKRLYRVFQNLIQNALQYALEGSRVYLSLKTYSGQAETVMRNTSKVELPSDVDFTARFVRGDASRTDGGSGLGLSIARSFTEACNGSFHVETLADLFTAIVTFPLS